jgi:hypothetical protein
MSKERSHSSSTFFVCVHLSSFEELISISQFLHVRCAPIAVENSASSAKCVGGFQVRD